MEVRRESVGRRGGAAKNCWPVRPIPNSFHFALRSSLMTPSHSITPKTELALAAGERAPTHRRETRLAASHAQKLAPIPITRNKRQAQRWPWPGQPGGRRHATARTGQETGRQASPPLGLWLRLLAHHSRCSCAVLPTRRTSAPQNFRARVRTGRESVRARDGLHQAGRPPIQPAWGATKHSPWLRYPGPLFFTPLSFPDSAVLHDLSVHGQARRCCVIKCQYANGVHIRGS